MAAPLARTLIAAAVLAFVPAGVAVAGVPQAVASPAPPVARISVADGDVFVGHGDGRTQVAAAVNAPLVPGEYLVTGRSGRGEIQFNAGTALRLGASTQVRIGSNAPAGRTIDMAEGTIALAIARTDGATTIRTPSVDVQAAQPGEYRVDIASDGATLVAARSGTVDVLTPEQRYTVKPGRALRASGDPQRPHVTTTADLALDEFDGFNVQRDGDQQAALAQTQVPADVSGYDDLSAYGDWDDVDGYGQAWVPDQSADWAPYRDGKWTWEDGYGYVWVGDEPWGWVPYHYGRWFYADDFGWCWLPPGAGTAWSPALVGFFGYGPPLWGSSLGYGYIGWVPLAPYEPLYPWYPPAPPSHPKPTPPPKSGVGPRRPPPVEPNPPRRLAQFGNAAHLGVTALSATAFTTGSFGHRVAAVPLSSRFGALRERSHSTDDAALPAQQQASAPAALDAWQSLGIARPPLPAVQGLSTLPHAPATAPGLRVAPLSRSQPQHPLAPVAARRPPHGP